MFSSLLSLIDSLLRVYLLIIFVCRKCGIGAGDAVAGCLSVSIIIYVYLSDYVGIEERDEAFLSCPTVRRVHFFVARIFILSLRILI